MLLCAVVGLALLVLGAASLPRPASVTRAAEPSAGTTPAAGPAPGATVPAPAPASAPAAPSAPSPTSAPDPGRSEAPRVSATFVPDRGRRTYRTADVSAPTRARAGRLYRVDVRVESGLPLDPDEVARTLAAALDDPRGWRATGRARFSLVRAGQSADLHAYVVTPDTTDRLCAPLLTRGDVSCQAGDKVVLNAKRWVLGADAYGDDVTAYRAYLANHEFGHALGRQHVGCPGRGEPAPVMLQQTKGLQGCTANPWPAVTRG